MTHKDCKTKPLKCPNKVKGIACHICGGTWLCFQSWRKKRTYKARIAERKLQEARAKEFR